MTRRFWTPAEIEAVRTRYPDERAEDIAADIGRSSSMVYSDPDGE